MDGRLLVAVLVRFRMTFLPWFWMGGLNCDGDHVPAAAAKGPRTGAQLKQFMRAFQRQQGGGSVFA